MHSRNAILLTRLRLHKGAWMLVFAAMLIKIATATACMQDGPRAVVSMDATGVSQSVETQADTLADQGDDCLLGEGSGCHCACAHAMALPAVAPSLALLILPPTVEVHPPVAPSLRAIGSPLRPPIA